MSKIVLAFALVATALFSAPSFADEAKVEATIYRIDFNLRLYEVCGVVSGDKAGMQHVTLIPDVGTKSEGHYNTMTNADGKFCQVIRIIGSRLDIQVPGMETPAQFKL